MLFDSGIKSGFFPQPFKNRLRAECKGNPNFATFLSTATGGTQHYLSL